MPMEGVIPKEDEDKIMHMALPVGNDILMASDAPESMGFKVVPGNAAYIMIGVDSKAEADRIFAALSAGGSVEMPLADQPWGDYYGSLKDKFGILWMISYTYPKKA
jgi:PhnB protein